MGAAAMFTSFATIRLLPLAEATMLSYLAPALMALMGWALLGERLGLRRLGGVAMGLAGGVVFGLPALSGNLPHGSDLFRTVTRYAAAVDPMTDCKGPTVRRS